MTRVVATCEGTVLTLDTSLVLNLFAILDRDTPDRHFAGEDGFYIG
tara:strand:- start:134 stop:271 length:138 start_codon:yes stop_codon:yes gene_type:complete